MKIFIVTPFFNERKHLSKFLSEILKYSLPVIVVDDGSSDDSKKIVRKLGSKKNLVVLEHAINLGKGSALKTGAEYAFSKGADVVIFMDADGQHKPSDLDIFIHKSKQGKFDVIFGSRNLKSGVPMFRLLGNKIAALLTGWVFDIKLSDATCGFRAISKHAFEKIRWDSAGYGVEIEMIARIAKNKLKYTEIPVHTIYHDHFKGVTILDAIGIFWEMIKWRFTI